ncbi:MAG: restriction endonuclease subunit S [Stellaceae bacterium]
MAREAWKRMPLGDFVTLQRGHDLPDERRRPGRVPILGSFGVTGWHDLARAPGPGVTVGRSGASFGVACFSPSDYWPLNTALYVIDFHGNDPRFAFYFLKEFDFRRYNSGSAQPSLNRNFVHPVPVDVPPLSEQRAIAHILGALDDKIELNRRMNETLERTARALFKSWFVDFDPVHAKAGGRDSGLPRPLADLFPAALGDDGKPLGWRYEPLLDHARLISGGTPKTEEPAYWNDGSIAWASAKDVSQCGDTFLVATERSITERGLNESATRVIPKFSTVVVARGATTGRFCMFGRDMAMNQTCYALASLCRRPFWLNCAFESLVEALVHAAHGSVFDTITTKTIEGARVTVASDDVLDHFEAAVNPLFNRALANIEEFHTLAALRDTLSPKLISGELRVKDAEKFIGRAV